MRGRTGRALALLLVGLLLGLAGEALQLWVPERLSLALWISAALLGATALIRLGALTALPPARWLAVAAWITIPCLIWRDSDVLFGLNMLWLGTLLVVVTATSQVRTLGQIPVSALILSGLRVAGGIVLGPLPALAGDIGWGDLPVAGRTRQLASVGIGLLAAIPVLVVFGALLGSADPLFAETISRLFGFDLWNELDHVFRVGLFAWIGIGILRSGFWLEGRRPAPVIPRPELQPTVLYTFVAAIGALLAVFVGFQGGELFLSAQDFQATMGITISEYARKGFFEMVAVAALSLPILHFAEWCLDSREQAAVVRFHRLTAVVIVLLTLILASAFYRMVLYESFYGLTEQRFYTLAFMLLLAGVFGWFGATVLRGRRSRFVPGALAGAFALLLTLNVVNPDAFIVRVNLERARGGAPLDQNYLTALSADAVPAILACGRRPVAGRALRCAGETAGPMGRRRTRGAGVEPVETRGGPGRGGDRRGGCGLSPSRPGVASELGNRCQVGQRPKGAERFRVIGVRHPDRPPADPLAPRGQFGHVGVVAGAELHLDRGGRRHRPRCWRLANRRRHAFANEAARLRRSHRPRPMSRDRVLHHDRAGAGTQQRAAFGGQRLVARYQCHRHTEPPRQCRVQSEFTHVLPVERHPKDAVGVGVIEDGVRGACPGVIADEAGGIEALLDSFEHRAGLGRSAHQFRGWDAVLRPGDSASPSGCR